MTPTLYGIISKENPQAKRDWCFANANGTWWGCYDGHFQFKDEQMYLMFCLKFQHPATGETQWN